MKDRVRWRVAGWNPEKEIRFLRLRTLFTRAAVFLAVGLGFIIPSTPAKAQAFNFDDRLSATGQGTFAVPITVPPGVGGLVPSVGLQYDSDAREVFKGKGVGEIQAALGWSASFSGYPSDVRRSLKPAGSPSFTVDDEFIWGSQELRLVGFETVNGKEVRSYVTDFLSFVKIQWVVPDDLWIMTLSNGAVLEYGVTQSERSISPTRKITYAWHLSRVSDTYGNQMTYHYTDPTVLTSTGCTAANSGGVRLLSRIVYGSPTYPQSVHFVHRQWTTGTSRPGATYRADYGGCIWFADLLDSIRTVSGSATYDASKEVLSYVLAYKTVPRGDFVLGSVTEAGGTGASRKELPPYSFTYEEGSSLLGELRHVTTPTGGRIEYTYAFQSNTNVVLPVASLPCAFANDELPLFPSGDPAVVSNQTKNIPGRRVLSHLTRTDPLTGLTTKTGFLYGDQRYDGDSREYRGFFYAKQVQLHTNETDPRTSTGPFSEVCILQSDWLQGTTLFQRSGEGNLVGQVTNTYDLENNPLGLTETDKRKSRWAVDLNGDGVIDPTKEITYFQRLAKTTTCMAAQDAPAGTCPLKGGPKNSSAAYTRSLLLGYDEYPVDSDGFYSPRSPNPTVALDQGEIHDPATAWQDNKAFDNVRSETTYTANETLHILGVVTATGVGAVKSGGVGFGGAFLSFKKMTYSADLRFLQAVWEPERFVTNLTPANSDLFQSVIYDTYHPWGAVAVQRTIVGEAGDPGSATANQYARTQYDYGSGWCGGGNHNDQFAPCKVTVASGSEIPLPPQVTTAKLDLRLGVPLEQISVDSVKTVSEYDSLGRLTKVKKPNASGTLVEVSNQTYTVVGKDLGPSNPNNTTATVLPDRFPAQVSTSFIDGFGEAVQTRASRGTNGLYSGAPEYDDLGQEVKTYLPFESSATGFVSSPPSGTGFSEQEYLAGRVIKATSPEGDGKRTVAETFSGVDPSEPASQFSQVTSDVENNLRRVDRTYVNGRGKALKTVENATGLRGTVARTTTFVLDAADRVTRTNDHNKNATLYGFGPRGQAVAKSMPDWTYPASLGGEVEPDINYMRRWDYDRGGHVRWELASPVLTSPPQSVVHAYDALGRETRLCVYPTNNPAGQQCATSDGNLRSEVVYDFIPVGPESTPNPNALGKVVKAESYVDGIRKSTQTYTYNKQGLISETTQAVDGIPVKMKYTYDSTGKLVALEVKGRGGEVRKAQYQYDDLGRLSAWDGVAAVRVNGVPIIQNVLYDVQGRPKEIVRGNETTTAYEYDDRFLQKLNHIGGKDENGNPVELYNILDYQYDLAGNITDITREPKPDGSSRRATYRYDGLDQLVGVQNEGFYEGAPMGSGEEYQYEYNEIGVLTRKIEQEEIAFTPRRVGSRIISFTVLPPAPNAGTYTPTYDDRGNMTYDGGMADGSWCHTYDFIDNKLSRSDKNGTACGLSSSGEFLDIQFDAQRRKIHRQVFNPVSGAYEGQRHYYYAGEEKVYELDGSSTVLYVFGPNGQRVAKINEKGEVEYWHQDHLGSTVALTGSDQCIPQTPSNNTNCLYK